MFLKNYTSNVPASQTIYRIEQLLIRCGVSGITKEYVSAAGRIGAITFSIQTDGNTPKLTVRLPADVEKAQDALWLNYAGNDLGEDGKMKWKSRKKLKRADFKEQAERTAWKIIQDWVEVQMSMIQMKQAEYREVFLPYVWDGEQTIYQRIKATNFQLMLPEKSSARDYVGDGWRDQG